MMAMKLGKGGGSEQIVRGGKERGLGISCQINRAWLYIPVNPKA